MKKVSGNRIDRTWPGPTARPGQRRPACETFGGTDAVQRARWFATAVAAQWGGGHAPDVLALVVSELVTNAVTHGGGSCEVGLVPTAGCIRVEVADRVPDPPVARQLVPGTEGGRGMLLIEALTSGWGVKVSAAGKVVWAQVPC